MDVGIIISSASQGVPLLLDSLFLAILISIIASASYLFKKWLICIPVLLTILVNIYWNVSYDEIMLESAREEYGSNHFTTVYILFNTSVVAFSVIGISCIKKLRKIH